MLAWTISPKEKLNLKCLDQTHCILTVFLGPFSRLEPLIFEGEVKEVPYQRLTFRSGWEW